MFLKRNFFSITLTILTLLAVSALFFRFIVLQDYVVTYEVECNPYVGDCFIYCEDDECEDIFYYKYVTKNVSDLKPSCGVDITDCEIATYCTESDSFCEITYCEDDPQECETLTSEDNIDSTEDFFTELEKLKEQI